MVAEYFVVQKFRPALEESRVTGSVPSTAPTWVPATLIIWLVAALIGQYVTWGLPSLNSLVFAFVAYVVLGKAGLIRAVGESRTMDAVLDETDVERLQHQEALTR
jgi:cytosine permease